MDCCTFCCVALILTVAFAFFFIFSTKRKMWQADGSAMRGKTAIVTGSNTGIGLETASELARYGAKVILACRDTAKAMLSRQEIINRLKDKDGHSDIEQRVVVEELDLASFDSIRAFAARMEKLERLDVLVNNAGVAFLNEKQLTKDGLEMTMGTNHFGHFLLTNLLLDLLKKSAPSRIVVVTSGVHFGGKIDFENLNSERSYSKFMAYASSKLANILFTRELARKLEGTGVIVNAAHPGAVITDVARHFNKFAVFVFKNLLKYVFKSALEGAQTSIFLAISQSPEVLVSGRYFADCRPAPISRDAQDDAVAKKLWEVSEKTTKLV